MNQNNEDANISYRQEGDYLIPDFSPPEPEAPISIWGRRHWNWLKENHPDVLRSLTLQGRLFIYLISLDEQADAMFRTVMDDICRHDGVTEELKATDQMEWVRRSTTAHTKATEIVNSELIYC